MKTLRFVLPLFLLSLSAFAQSVSGGGVQLDCGGLHFAHRGKLESAVKLSIDELEQIRKADTDLAEATRAHDAALGKIKAAHGATDCPTWSACVAGTDVVFADAFALVYRWENGPAISW
jgi:hypothetical protein